jgi:uncharacterized HAD superfamily protein
LKICVDLDGVLFSFNQAYHDKLVKVTGENKFPTDWYAPVWDWDKHYGYTADEIAATMENISVDKLFWRKLKPIADASVFARLNVLSKSNDVYFLTNRFGIECKQQTERALYDHGINYPTVVIAADKIPVLKSIKADFFADDKLDTMNAVQSSSLFAKHQYLINAPYNQTGRSPGLQVATDIKDALEKAGLW